MSKIEKIDRGHNAVLRFITDNNKMGEISMTDKGLILHSLLGSNEFTKFDGDYLIFGNESVMFRIGIRSNSFVTDKTLTVIGFDGTENVDWENIMELE